MVGEVDALRIGGTTADPAWIGPNENLDRCDQQARQHQERTLSCAAMARVRVMQVNSEPAAMTTAAVGST
ncbi:hypothetical protein D3C81_1719680 [compost metagenome]